MASEPSGAGGDDGGADGLRRMNRWPSDDKVYRRRSFKRPRLGLGSESDATATATAAAPTPVPAGEDDVTSSHGQPDPAQPSPSLLLPAPGGSPLGNDSSSLEKQVEAEALPQDSSPTPTPPKEEIVDGHVRIRVSAWSRREIRELRRRLADELERVRSLLGRLEPVTAEPMRQDDDCTTVERPLDLTTFERPLEVTTVERPLEVTAYEGQLEVTAYERPLEFTTYERPPEVTTYKRQLEVTTYERPPEVTTVERPLELTTFERPPERVGRADMVLSFRTPRRPQITVSLPDKLGATDVVTPVVEKEKRTPKANQFYRNSDFILGKEKVRLTQESNKKSKSNGGGPKFPPVRDKLTARAFKQCMNLVTKLIRHRYGWVFDKPVDVVGLRLHDYYDIIKHPMDLGTVKSRLENNWYDAPRDFASDVRLTFRNAMKYNPETQDVHVLAKQLLNIFEVKWADIEFEYSRNLRFESSYGVGPPAYMMKKMKTQAPPPELRRNWDWADPAYTPAEKVQVVASTPTGRTPALKKPKAKDLNKRDMTFDEKQKLGMNLLKLPPEKQENVIQIIQRHSEVQQHDDGIEVDIDSFDAETLWELDRLVTNYKKSLSKIKRRAEIAQAKREANVAKVVRFCNPVPVNVEAQKEIRTVGKDASHSLPVQGENNVENGENGSISSTSSSSSSDSDTSSSGSDSESSSTDSDGGHSPKT